MTVLHRDGYRCVRCGAPAQGQRGWDWSLQHRLPRSAGVDNRACNLLTTCGNGSWGCHHYMDQQQRAEAYDKGWAVHRGFAPESVPVLVDHESRWVHLSVDGRYLDPEEVPA